MRPFAEAAARSTGVEALPITAYTPDEIRAGLLGLSQLPGGGLIAMPDSFVVSNAQAVIGSAEQYRMPAIYPFRFLAELGGLISYGVDPADLVGRAASYVDRILKGEKPADLPVQAPTKYELVINMKTAKVLGLDVPPSLLARADEVIE